ncbi:hypothetical protein [Telluribacter sp.]|uniref:hypothetical protein n=1 Tax=Telluribacter sp. TaxID=1978767 RepID=UPI002E14A8E5|nr:hypothetical protein [Telluribacter sp.]
MLTTKEIEVLKKEYEGHTVGFSVFCREKLLNREAITLSKPLDEGIRKQMTNLLRFSGTLLLLAKKTQDHAPISEDFQQMAASVKELVQRAVYSVNEVTYSQSLIIAMEAVVWQLEIALKKAEKESNPSNLTKLRQITADMRTRLEDYIKQYHLKSLTRDRKYS